MSKLLKAYPGKPAKHDFIVIRGDTFSTSFTAYDKEGQPYDFTGHTFRMQVRTNRRDDAKVVVDIPNENFHITADQEGIAAGKDNMFEIKHPAEDMLIPPGTYVYDIEMTDAAGNRQTIVEEENFFKVNPDVTK